MEIALLEDDPDQAALLSLWIQEAGHGCETFAEGEGFRAGFDPKRHDLAVLDWMLPDTSGEEVLAWLRENHGWALPVLFVTARDDEADVVTALRAGADDYMAKPIGREELIARLEALNRRRCGPEPARATPEQAVGHLTVDTTERTIRRHGEPVPLTQKEYELAAYLLANVGQLLPRAQLLADVWGHAAVINTRTVDTHISRLRTKLGLFPENGWRLSAVYQHGYRLERLSDAESA